MESNQQWYQRLPAISWAVGGVVDQTSGLYSLLPERWRGWIEGYVIAPIVAVLMTAAFVFFGLFREIDPYWLAFSAVVVLFSLTVLAYVGTRCVMWIRQSVFDVRPTSTSGVSIGFGDDVLFPNKTYARISVTSKRDIERCAALVTEVHSLENRRMVQLIWNPRYLSWTPEEEQRRTATLSAGITMMADLAASERSDDDDGIRWSIASADNGKRHSFPKGLFKIKVTVVGESSGGARRDAWFALTVDEFLLPDPVKSKPRLVVQSWRDSFVPGPEERRDDSNRLGQGLTPPPGPP